MERERGVSGVSNAFPVLLLSGGSTVSNVGERKRRVRFSQRRGTINGNLPLRATAESERAPLVAGGVFRVGGRDSLLYYTGGIKANYYFFPSSIKVRVM